MRRRFHTYERDTCIYFVGVVGGGRIKIGQSDAPADRLSFLMGWSPVDIELLAFAPGLGACEYVLKEKYRAQYVRNEWYEPSDDLASFVRDVRATGALPEWLHDAARRCIRARRRIRDGICAVPPMVFNGTQVRFPTPTGAIGGGR